MTVSIIIAIVAVDPVAQRYWVPNMAHLVPSCHASRVLSGDFIQLLIPQKRGDRSPGPLRIDNDVIASKHPSSRLGQISGLVKDFAQQFGIVLLVVSLVVFGCSYNQRSVLVMVRAGTWCPQGEGGFDVIAIVERTAITVALVTITASAKRPVR